MEDLLRCVIYTRVSTDSQAEVNFNSCEAQKNKICSFIDSQDTMVFYKLYSDPGYTGANTNRPGLNLMLDEIKSEKIDLIIVYKIDRLTRSPKDFYQMMEYFEKYGVSFISITERFDTSTPSGRLLRNIMLTFSQFERELTGERVRDKLLERAQKGFPCGGYAPLGYRRRNKKLIIDSYEAEAVKLIYQKYINKTSLLKILEQLQRNNFHPKNGTGLDKNTIFRTLRNPIYTGVIFFKGKIYKGIHKAIISKELFNQAQKKHLKLENQKNSCSKRCLGGLVICAECNKVMVSTYSIKKKKAKKYLVQTKYYYYRCVTTFKKGWHVCSTKQINAIHLEDYILSNLKRISYDKSYIENLLFKLKHSQKDSDYNNIETHLNQKKTANEIDDTIMTPDYITKMISYFLKELHKKQGLEKNLIVKKFIKNIIYSKSL